jgi:type IV secretion system protein VirB10
MTQDSPGASPDYLPNTPPKGQGVRRLNRVPLLIAVGVAVTMACVVIYTVNQRRLPTAGTPGSPTNTAPSHASDNGTLPQILSGAPSSGIIAPASVGTGAHSEHPSSPAAAGSSSADIRHTAAPTPGVPATSTGAVPQDETYREYLHRLQEVELQRFDAARQALQAATAVDPPRQSSGTGTTLTSLSLPDGSSQSLREAVARANAAAGGMPDGTAVTNALTPAGGGLNTQNGQSAKRDFLNQQQSVQSNYLKATRVAPISPYEIKAGTIIPAVMVGGVNSDLPGQLIAQVSQNVYDSATGRYLLIPQGCKLIGTYDNHVTFGQSRILVGWHRVIYPDASSLDLGLMPGTDESGYAGFRDRVDNHLIRLFSQAFLLSIFSAGIQLGQPQANVGTNYNSTQIVASAIAQQMGELGQEIVRRNMDIAPTLMARPGYLFNVMVTKDVILQPWIVATQRQ